MVLRSSEAKLRRKGMFVRGGGMTRAGRYRFPTFCEHCCYVEMHAQFAMDVGVVIQGNVAMPLSRVS
jgi:hypothetical protein